VPVRWRGLPGVSLCGLPNGLDAAVTVTRSTLACRPTGSCAAGRYQTAVHLRDAQLPKIDAPTAWNDRWCRWITLVRSTPPPAARRVFSR